MDLIALAQGIISMSLTNTQLIELSLIIISIAFILIIAGLIILFIASKKGKEEETASAIIRKINQKRVGKKSKKLFSIPKINLVKSKEKVKEENKTSSKVEDKLDKAGKKLEIKKDEVSLKQLLIAKFKPKIEKQLKTKIKIDDFNASKDEFVAKVEVQGHKLELKLDSSGKIIDYKNLDNN
jgi:hypothetical protein